MAGRCMFYLTFIWFSGAAYNVWQLVLNTSCYVPIVTNGNITQTLGLPVFPPSPSQGVGKYPDLGLLSGAPDDLLFDPSEDSLFDSVSYDDIMSSELKVERSEAAYASSDLPTLNSENLTSSPMEEDVFYSVKQCGAYQHFRQLHIGFYAADILVIHCIPFVVLVYLYSSMLVHLYSTRGFSEVQNKRRIILSALLAVVFYCCYLPLELVDSKMAKEDFVTWRKLKTRKFVETFSFTHGLWVFVLYLACSKEVAWLIQRRGSVCQHVTTGAMNVASTNQRIETEVKEQTEPCLKKNRDDSNRQQTSLIFSPPMRRGCIQTEL